MSNEKKTSTQKLGNVAKRNRFKGMQIFCLKTFFFNFHSTDGDKKLNENLP